MDLDYTVQILRSFSKKIKVDNGTYCCHELLVDDAVYLLTYLLSILQLPWMPSHILHPTSAGVHLHRSRFREPQNITLIKTP